MIPTTVPYTHEELKAALDSLMDGRDPSEGSHLFGYGDPNHKLSMLQTVEATQILDYRAKFAKEGALPSLEDLIEQKNQFAQENGPILNLQKVIQNQSPRMALAAEFKRASPSKGNIAVHLNCGEQAKLYASAGANIISVLTEPHWFLGSLEDMQQARLQTATERPAILRKEFVFDKYMVAEAAAWGADTILLIVAVLPLGLLKELIDYCRELGMEPLVEVHADAELRVALEAGARVIGVNNRNLHTFQMDMARTLAVAEELSRKGLVYDHNNDAAEYTLCTLSGMSTALDVNRYRQAGVGMCLIGESLMRAVDPARAIQGLCLDPKDFQSGSKISGGAYTAGTKLVKVCGITNSTDALTACRAGANLIGVIFAERSKRRVSVDQAQEVVQAVRKYGERSDRTTVHITENGNKTPLPKLVASAHALEDAARRPMVVGVFQNQTAEFIRDTVDQCGLDLVQLHGNEGMEAANVALCGVPAIRVVDIATDPSTGKAIDGASQKILELLTMDPLAILLDTSIKGSKEGGGTGVTFDWNICQEVQNAGLPVIIAGGLRPDNVRNAVETIRPWGVDVSSGVEESPGKKDTEKVQEFVKNAREAALEASKGF